MSKGTIKKWQAPGNCTGMRDANMFDVVRVSSQRLIGEILRCTETKPPFRYMRRPRTGTGEPVESMEVPLSVELGPGLIASIYDGSRDRWMIS